MGFDSAQHIEHGNVSYADLTIANTEIVLNRGIDCKGKFNSASHRFWQFSYGALILGSSQFSLLPQLPQNLMLDERIVKNY
jgi:hypothetical protein